MLLNRSKHQISSPVSATALIVDLRNFTSSLNASKKIGATIDAFCLFLSEFYAVCIDACLTALPPQSRLEPPLYMNSTGDGVLIVFLGDCHVNSGFLAALLMHSVLMLKCERYNSNIDPNYPRISFGIGVESGEVSYVYAGGHNNRSATMVHTYIGECINIAARAEAMTKIFYGARTIIAHKTNELLCKKLFRQSYPGLIRKALDPTLPDKKRMAVHDKMNNLNRALCLTFIHHHNLRGVDEPTPLFRIADSSANPGNPRFDLLIEKLCEGNDHRSDAIQFLSSSE